MSVGNNPQTLTGKTAPKLFDEVNIGLYTFPDSRTFPGHLYAVGFPRK